MIDIDKPLIDQLIVHEGLRLKLYRCSAGKLTIGVGHNIDDLGITRAQALNLLMDDVRGIRQELGSFFKWFYALDRVRRDAVTDMAFNLGITRFRGFKRMIDAFRNGDFDRAAFEMIDSKWARQVGNRAVFLAEMVRTGKRCG